MIEYIKDNFDYPLIGAEIGVGNGDHAWQMVQNLHLLKLYLIDHWQSYREQPKGHLITAYQNKDSFVRERLAGYPVEIIKSDSLTAAQTFQNNYFDFVYIDANPSYESTNQNINAWWDKVKSGGVVGGNNQKWAETWRAVCDKLAGLKERDRVFVKENEWWVVKV